MLERVPAAYYTDERQAILESAREFAMKEVLPVANELDPVQGEIPMSLRDKLAELGYFGILIPQEYGGLGLGIFEYVLVTEELARAWMSVASIIARGNGLGGGFSEEHRRDDAAEDGEGRVPRRLRAVRAARRLRRRLDPLPRRARPAIIGWSTVRRCGARSPTAPTFSSWWREPSPTIPSTVTPASPSS